MRRSANEYIEEEIVVNLTSMSRSDLLTRPRATPNRMTNTLYVVEKLHTRLKMISRYMYRSL